MGETASDFSLALRARSHNITLETLQIREVGQLERTKNVCSSQQ